LAIAEMLFGQSRVQPPPPVDATLADAEAVLFSAFESAVELETVAVFVIKLLLGVPTFTV
jgi:hypothetical protein